MSVYKETRKEKITKDGRQYYYRCYYTDKYGKRKRKRSKLYKGKRECEKAERDFLETVQYKDIPNYDISFKDVYNEWLDYKRCTVKETSMYCIKKKTDKHILTFFDNYKLHSIKIPTLIEWKQKLLNDKSINESSVNKMIGYMKEILQYAINNYEFDIKIANKLQKNKIEVSFKKRNSEFNFFTYEEWKQFISVVDDEFYYLVFNFLYYTGLRVGEFNALNWNDIDFERKELRINKSLSEKIENRTYAILDPKTTNSIRIIDLDDNLIDLLKKHYEEEKKIIGFNNDMFIFGNTRYLPQTTLRRYLNNYIKLANVKHITIHGFRHSHASLLINLGLDSRDVAERLGDTIQIVEKTYYHMFPSKKSNVVNALNKIKDKKWDVNGT